MSGEVRTSECFDGTLAHFSALKEGHSLFAKTWLSSSTFSLQGTESRLTVPYLISRQPSYAAIGVQIAVQCELIAILYNQVEDEQQGVVIDVG